MIPDTSCSSNGVEIVLYCYRTNKVEGIGYVKTAVIGSEAADKRENTDFIAANSSCSIELVPDGKTCTSHNVHNTRIGDIILELTGKK